MSDRIDAAVRGALSGFLATLPMTLVMEGLRQKLPWYERYPLPPRLITGSIASQAGVRHHLTHEQEQELSWSLHYLFGTSMGAAYGLLTPNRPKNRLLRGALLGCTVWAASYQGWLPALGILPASSESPARRVGLMIAAHLVWGVATTELENLLRTLSEQNPKKPPEVSLQEVADSLETETPEPSTAV